MTAMELRLKLDCELIAGSEETLSREVSGAYCGDLLSWVMGRAEAGNAWITIMPNINVAAVASLADVSCVILAEGARPDKELLARAEREELPLFASPKSAYELCWRIKEALT